MILTQLLERRGVDVRAEEAGAWSKSRVASLDVKDVALICLCYIETPSPAQIHFAVRRLRRKAPAAIILVALLGATNAVDDEEVVQTLVKLDLIKSTLHATIERILAITAEPRNPKIAARRRRARRTETQAPRAISSKATHRAKGRPCYHRTACEPRMCDRREQDMERRLAKPAPWKASTQGGVNF